MKKIFYLNLVLILSLLSLGCDQSKKTTPNIDNSVNSVTPADSINTITTDNKSNVDIKENNSKTSESKEETLQKSVSLTNPPRVATKDILMDSLVFMYNNPKAPLSKKQIGHIYDLANDSKVTIFYDQTECISFKREMDKKIKGEILSPEQLLLYPGRSKKK